MDFRWVRVSVWGLVSQGTTGRRDAQDALQSFLTTAEQLEAVEVVAEVGEEVNQSYLHIFRSHLPFWKDKTIQVDIRYFWKGFSFPN